MPKFKCISCGEIKDSEGICSCPNCGYRMFEIPYDRKNVLISEVTSFITRMEVTTIKREDLSFEGKDKDEKRFPSYDKILKYVSGQDRTEDFLSNLLETAEQLRLHFTSEFSNTYPISFENLDRIIRRYDDTLYAAAEVLASGCAVKLKPMEWEKASLLYTETLNKYLWFSANELVGLIEKLAKKIVKFIRVNNLYGNIHKYYPPKRCDQLAQETDFKDVLENAIWETEKILNKKYVVDITEDGADELREMLTSLWNAVELIMCSPLFMENFEYLTADGRLNETEFFAHISDLLQCRYTDYNNAIDIPHSLDGKSEEELFDIYKEMISIDDFGFLVPIERELINIGESEKKLEKMIGLSGVKESIQKIKAYALTNKKSKGLNIHMCFMGNPGTGKTEVARYIAGILYENKILPTNKVVEVDRSGLVSQYFGATAEKTSRVIMRAMGGVLFVDEAYALGNNSDTSGVTDYGKEAIDTLVKAMEDHRGEFCVIFAGYKNEMQRMLSINPGLKSRIQFILDFPNYTRDELKSIAELMLKNRQYTIGDAALAQILDITDIKRKEPNFSNAREIRNILDQVIMCQNVRVAGAEDSELGIADVNKYIRDAKIILPTGAGNIPGKVLSGEEELDQLIGLAPIKRMVKKIKAYAKRNKGEEDFNLHMCFYGNPGTGKTEVARILSRILYDAGVLEEAKLVETDAYGLMGKCVGETAPKTEATINEAVNGVLFIDEAYSLIGPAAGGVPTSYGEEAIAVLLKEMEDRRGQFCVILAGYKAEMTNLLQVNPGFKSRIQFVLEFPDYTREELGEIAKLFLVKKGYEFEEMAFEKFLDVAEYYRSLPNFANARTVRNILAQVLMNQNLRTEDMDDEKTIKLEDIEDYLADEGIDLAKPAASKGRIGFV